MNQYQIRLKIFSAFARFHEFKHRVVSSPHFSVGVIVLSFCLLIFLASAITWITKSQIFSEKEKGYTLPTDIYLASDYCQEKIEKKLGDRLLRSYMDERSSREEAFIYRVFFKADVGTLADWDEVMIYCYVDRWKLELAYFKEINPNVKQIKSTDLQFFK